MQQTFENRILAFNIKRMISSAKIILCISILLAILNFSIRLFNNYQTPYFIGYLWIYSALVIVNVAFLCYFFNFPTKKKNKKSDSWLVEGYIGIMVIFGGIITYFDAHHHGHILMFILFYLLCSMLFVTKVRYMLPISLLSTWIVISGVTSSKLMASDSNLYIIFLISILSIGTIIQIFISRSQRLMLWQQEQLELEGEKSKKLTQQLEQSNAELELANSQLKSMALYDSLTKLPNRYAFLAHVQTILQQHNSVQCMLFVLDIDFFKQYNDMYGHPKGDAVLSLVANEFSSVAKSHDMYIARWGGEEFVGISVCDNAQAERQCQLLLTTVSNLQIEHKSSEANPYLTVSVGGYAANLESFSELEVIYIEADKALYEAKENGRNGYVLKFEHAVENDKTVAK